MFVTCLECKTEFDKNPYECKKSKNHFCSRKCSVTFNNKIHIKRSSGTKTCKRCNETYHGKKCYQKHERLTNHRSTTLAQYAKNIKDKSAHPSWAFSQIRSLNRYWNKALRSLGCQVCNYKVHVELAHIKPLSSFSDEVTIAEINDPANILVLCPNHHWEFDNHVLSLTDIPPRT